MDESRPVVVAFDFDHTLTVRDSVVPFMGSVAGWTNLLWAAARRPGGILRALARRDRDGLKAVFSGMAFSGRTVAEVEEAGIVHARRVVEGWMRADVAERLRVHQSAGHVVVIVSASFGPYMHPLGDMLEVDAVLCTELESVDGVLTGNLLGANCRGEEKARRMSAWLESAGLPADSLLVAYGDSAGDEALLSMARRAVWVDDDLATTDDSVDVGDEIATHSRGGR